MLLQLPFHDEALDSRLKLMQDMVRTIRSMKLDYLPAKVKPEGELYWLQPLRVCGNLFLLS